MVYLGFRGRGLIAAVTASSGMGFILFGYDNGVIGGLLTAPDFVDLFELNSVMQGTVTSLFEIGCVIGCILSSLNGDRLGRLTFIHVGSVILCLGAILQSSSYTVAQLIVGRIVAGVGLGCISSNVTVWQSELVPRDFRGTLVCCTLSFLIAGSLLAYWLDYAMNSYVGSVSWRFPMAFQAFIALTMSIMLFFMPESPRWLLLHDRDDDAAVVLKALKKNDSENDTVAWEITEIKDSIARESNTKGWSDLLKTDAVHSRRRVVIAVVVQSLQAFSGSTPINYYTTVIFENSIGFSRHMALLMSGFLDIWFLVASFGTWYLIERTGRRRLFLLTATGMSIVLIVFAIMLKINTYGSGIVSAVMLFLYVSLFTWGWMGGCWVYPAEILPLEFRSKGMGLAVGCQWMFSFLMIEVTPVGISNIGWKFYLVFAAFNALFVPIVYFFVPETAGLTLEAIDLIFMDKERNPVQSANALWEVKAKQKEVEANTLTQAYHLESMVDTDTPSISRKE